MTLPGADHADLFDEVISLVRERSGYLPWSPHLHQIPPEGDWFLWLMEMGRGSGKTATASHVVADHLDGPACISEGLPHRVSLIAPTLGDAIESAHLTDMSLTRVIPGATFRQTGGGSMVRHPNGSQVRLFGCHTKEDVERLRAGGNRCFVWAEELAAWRHLTEAWTQMMLGLRLGPNPRIVATTTPKPRPEYVAIRETADHISHATTLQNPDLNAEQVARLMDLYEGTTIGEQELHGKLIEEAEGAIWTMDLIERERRSDLLQVYDDAGEQINVLSRVVVAVDPPGGATEAGIVAAGTLAACPCGNGAALPHYAVLEDGSAKLTPERWAAKAISLYDGWEADRIVAEKNYGGDMVKSVISTVDQSVAYKAVTATRGKRIRAEPIKALYEQRRVHHVGVFEALEVEQVQWVPDESLWSPNRLDALVWAITELHSRRPWKVG